MRRIGPIGTWTRVVVGVGLVVLGVLGSVRPSGVVWAELVGGVVGIPLIMAAVGLAVRQYRTSPLLLEGTVATGVNCLVIVALVSNRVTGPAVELFYGATLLVAAWRGQPGCELTVVSNLLFRREDQVGCPVFSPLDRYERRRHRENAF